MILYFVDLSVPIIIRYLSNLFLFVFFSAQSGTYKKGQEHILLILVFVQKFLSILYKQISELTLQCSAPAVPD